MTFKQPPIMGAHPFGKNIFENHFSKIGWATLRLNRVLISDHGATGYVR